MPITPEERARIARENGAKSKGPVTPEGKERSSMNALKSGEYANKFAPFEPHYAVVCHEDRAAFKQLHQSFVHIYQPANIVAHDLVRDMAIARWQIERLHVVLTMNWNTALFDARKAPITLPAELADIEYMSRATNILLAGTAVVARINREIVRLQKQVAFLQRQLKFVHQNFPRVAPDLTQPDPVEIVENTEPDTEQIEQNEPALVITEDSPAVIAAYRREFPNRKIVILPPDNVARGIDDADDLPPVPRIPV